MVKTMTIILAVVALFHVSLCAVARVQEGEHAEAASPLPYTCTVNSTHNRIQSKSGRPEESARWPGGVLVYEISSEFSKSYAGTITACTNCNWLSFIASGQVKLIEQAQLEISKATGDCVTFRQRNSSDVSFVFIQKGRKSGCSAQVGREDGMTVMSLSENCFRWPIISHEFIHSLGFHHEHQREDRDDHVTVHFNNILPGKEHNFVKVIPSQTFRVPYDYDSVMHYPKTAFATAEGHETITPKKNVTIGQTSHISYYDSLKLRRMYKCESI